MYPVSILDAVHREYANRNHKKRDYRMINWIEIIIHIINILLLIGIVALAVMLSIYIHRKVKSLK